MTPELARELMQQQIEFSSGYNRDAMRLILGEVQRKNRPAAADEQIVQLALEEAFGLQTGTDFSKVAR